MNNLDRIISKFNIDENGNPNNIHILRKHQISPIYNGFQLDQIPNDRYGVNVVTPEGMYEVYSADEVSENTYYVKNDGVVLFDKSMAGKEVVIDYYGRGLELIGASRVYTMLDAKGNIIETLGDIFDVGRIVIDAIKTVGDVIVVLEKISDDVEEANRIQPILHEDIRVATPLEASLAQNVNRGEPLLESLAPVVSEGTRLDTSLPTKVNEGVRVEQELEDAILRGDIPTMKSDIVELGSQLSDNVTKTNILENNKTDKKTTENIQQQVNNLVLGAVGDGNNAEVIQARGKYSVLNDRLDITDNILNLKLENKINKNSWSRIGCSITEADDILSIIADGSRTEPYIYQAPFDEDSIYYIKATMRVVNSNATDISVSANTRSLVKITNPVLNEWYDISLIKDKSSETYLRLYTYYRNTDEALNSITEIKDNVLILNLTEIFGIGNEPSKEEIEKLIDKIGTIEDETNVSQKVLTNYMLDYVRNTNERFDNEIKGVIYNKITVGKTAPYNFTTIKSAVQSITDASYYNRYLIYVKNGVYNEVNVDIKKHYIDIEGESRDGVILRSDGTSDEWGSVDLFSKHGMWVTSTNNISHLTIDVNDVKYCVHLDGEPDDTDKNYDAVFRDCHFIHRDRWVVGAGARAGQNMTFEDCIFEMSEKINRSPGSVENTCGMNWHNWNNQSERAMLNLIRCKFINCGIVQFGDLGSEQDDIVNIIDCTTNNLEQGIYAVYNADFWKDSNGNVPKDLSLLPQSIRLNLVGDVPNIEMFNYQKDRKYYHANGYYDIPILNEINTTIEKGMAVSLNYKGIANMRYTGKIMSSGTNIFGVALEDIGYYKTGWVSMKDKVTFGLMEIGTYNRGDLLKVTDGVFSKTTDESEAVGYVLFGGDLTERGLLKIKIGL